MISIIIVSIHSEWQLDSTNRYSACRRGPPLYRTSDFDGSVVVKVLGDHLVMVLCDFTPGVKCVRAGASLNTETIAIVPSILVFVIGEKESGAWEVGQRSRCKSRSILETVRNRLGALLDGVHVSSPSSRLASETAEILNRT